jgi:hypothetical protein
MTSQQKVKLAMILVFKLSWVVTTNFGQKANLSQMSSLSRTAF